MRTFFKITRNQRSVADDWLKGSRGQGFKGPRGG